MNGYVTTAWPRVAFAGGRELLHAWYDRPYEYAWAMAHLDAIARQVDTPLRVLDVGPGGYQPWIDELAGRGYEVDAIDADPAAVAQVAVRLPSVFVTCGNVLDASLGVYDVVTCLSVIEHDPDWRRLLRHLLAARRLLLTFGVVRNGQAWPEMYVTEADARETAAIAHEAGCVVDLDSVPPDAVVGHGYLLTAAFAGGVQ